MLTSDPEVRQCVASASSGRLFFAGRELKEMVATMTSTPPSALVVDVASTESDADTVLKELGRLAARAQTLVVLLRRGEEKPVPGADVVVPLSALPDVLELADRALQLELEPPPELDRLLGVSFVSRALQSAIEVAADEVAAGFGVDRCLLSVRGDSSGGAATGEGTWTSLSWSQAASHCRAALAARATLVTPPTSEPHASESYLAVPLSSPQGEDGFLALVAERPRLFTAAERHALHSLASRLSAELSFRGLHDWAVEELERLSHGPGLDRLLGIWNRIALVQLGAMQAAGARRDGAPLSAVVLDVNDLQAINVRYGLAAGDAVLRRLADAVRALVRQEDVVGRWSGDEVGVLLHGSDTVGARRVAERLLCSLRERPVELPNGETIALSASAGISELKEQDPLEQILARASKAAKKAQGDGVDILSAELGNTTPPRISQQFETVRHGVTLDGAYRILHEISRGGMGVVYRAEDLALERPVAIKMLRPDLTEREDVAERFRVEAAMLAHLQHPNLVQVYSFGHSGGDSYFVMELVEGESLEQAFDRCRLEGTAMPLTELAVVIEQVGSALDTLHERGIVHRDVKPANVILDPFRGRSVLVDVGIARRYEQRTLSAGTPGYVAPEVIGGAEATARSDVYGLAATAYAMLTLEPPWGRGNLPEVLDRQRAAALRPPSAIRPEVRVVDEIVTAAMSLEPSERPASAGAFARALSAAICRVVGVEETSRARGRVGTGRQSALTRGEQRDAGREASGAKTRGLVFRSVAFAVGVREAERLRDSIGGEHPDLARALAPDTAPLTWLPSELFTTLLRVAPARVGRDRLRLARDMARAAVRASFRRFFPASSATLVPERTLSAIRSVWRRYHTWGVVSSMPIHATEVVVRIVETPRDPALCSWTNGLLEQLVVLSGGELPNVHHYACEVRGDEACLFRVNWERRE